MECRLAWIPLRTLTDHSNRFVSLRNGKKWKMKVPTTSVYSKIATSLAILHLALVRFGKLGCLAIALDPAPSIPPLLHLAPIHPSPRCSVSRAPSLPVSPEPIAITTATPIHRREASPKQTILAMSLIRMSRMPVLVANRPLERHHGRRLSRPSLEFAVDSYQCHPPRRR